VRQVAAGQEHRSQSRRHDVLRRGATDFGRIVDQRHLHRQHHRARPDRLDERQLDLDGVLAVVQAVVHGKPFRRLRQTPGQLARHLRIATGHRPPAV
jgi:hypothetical protein